jgi:hypothetical protein
MKVEKLACCAPNVHARATSSLCCLGLLTILVVDAPGVARAATTSSPAPGPLFGVHPEQQGSTTLPGGHFNFALVPGESVTDGIVVENFSDRMLRFHVYGADLITATGGGVAPAQPTATMHQAGAWIVISRPMVILPAHSQLTDLFALTVPAVVASGQHLGAVVAAADVGLTPQGNPIEARTALITVVTVPGTAHALARLGPLLGSNTPAGAMGFGITLFNTGNVLLTYSGFLNIDDAHGHRVATVPLTPIGAYVVPTGQAPLAAVWKQTTSASETDSAQAIVTILADGKPVRTLTSQLVALRFSSGIPIPILALITGLALALMAIVVIGRRPSRRRRPGRSGSGAGPILGTRLTRPQ